MPTTRPNRVEVGIFYLVVWQESYSTKSNDKPKEGNMPRGTEHEPMAKLRRHDELKLHFTKDELQELEDRARGWMRMDADVKIKLINGNRYALEQRQLIRELWHEARRVADFGADISEDLLKRAKLYI